MEKMPNDTPCGCSPDTLCSCCGFFLVEFVVPLHSISESFASQPPTMAFFSPHNLAKRQRGNPVFSKKPDFFSQPRGGSNRKELHISTWLWTRRCLGCVRVTFLSERKMQKKKGKLFGVAKEVMPMAWKLK
jgi:hypothetical protein